MKLIVILPVIIAIIIIKLLIGRPPRIKYKQLSKPLKTSQLYELKNGDVQYYNTATKQGVYSCINDELLQSNWHENRNNSVRVHNYPRGWDKIHNRKYHGMYLYHRTHLAPFRYTLLEDDRVIVTATSELNCGLKPLANFSPNIENWQKYTYDLIKHHQHQVLIDPPRPNNKTNTTLSLEDFERLSTRFIKKYPSHHFVYHGQANYSEPNNPPDSVSVEFLDQTKHRILFEVTLTNRW